MEVAYATLIESEYNEELIDDNYIDIDDKQVIELLIEYPHFIKNNFIIYRLKKMISINYP